MQQVQQTIAVPAEIQQVASEYQMGAIRQVYGPNTRLARVNKTGAGCMLLFGLATCILGIASIAGGAAGWVWIILGVAAGGGGCLFFLLRASTVENKNVKIYGCEQGLIYKNGASPANLYRWDQIAAVWRNVRIIHNYASRQINPTPIVRITYTIERRDGHTFQLDNTIGGFDALENIITTKTQQVLLPPLLRDYAQGRTLAFGPLALNQQGVLKGQELLPWSQIEAIEYRIDYNKEIIRVKRQGAWLNWANISTSDVPNLKVFLALIDSVRTRAVPASQVPPRAPNPPAGAFSEKPAQSPGSQASRPAPGSALDILQQRFARGEIDAETYRQMLATLTSPPANPPRQ